MDLHVQARCGLASLSARLSAQGIAFRKATGRMTERHPFDVSFLKNFI